MSSILTELTTQRSDSHGKHCHRCGTDLSDAVRYRDQSGYWCIACHQSERKAYRANHLPCDDCGSDVRRGTEWKWEDRRLCDVCWQKRRTAQVREENRRTAAANDEQWRARRRRTWKHIIIVACEIVAAIGLFVMISRLIPG